MALQMADAYAEAPELARRLADGRGDAASHRGLRARPDEMVGILGIYQQRGEGESPFHADEIAALVHLEPRPWTMAANELHRLDADLDFATDLPHGSSWMHPNGTRRSAAACRCDCCCR
jgi:hypothetical protein